MVAATVHTHNNIYSYMRMKTPEVWSIAIQAEKKSYHQNREGAI